MTDIYLLGRHRIMVGDATNESDVNKLMDNKKADMVFTDPPWEDYILESFDNIKNSLSNTGSYYVCAPQGDELALMINVMKTYGLPTRQIIVWKRDKAINSHGKLDYDYIHNNLLYGWLNKHNFYGKNKTSVWEIEGDYTSDVSPDLKPVELPKEAIRNSSKENDIVLDLYLGAGSTLIACEHTNRICYGMDINNSCIDKTIRRWEIMMGKKAVKL